METICLQCGDRGFTNAFVYCVRCLDFAVHRYCLDVIPETFDEFVDWVCDHCDTKDEKQSTLQKCDTIACQTRDHTVSKTINGLARVDENDMVVSQSEEHGCEGDPQHSYNVRKKLDYVDCAQSDSKCSPARGKEINDGSAFLSEPDERKRCQYRSSLQLEKLSDDILLNRKMNNKRSAISESTSGNDQYILEKTSPNQAHEEHLNVDIRECANLASHSPPSFKSSKKKKIVMCAEANSEEQRHKIGSAQLLEENNGLDLKAQGYDTSAERSGICLSKKINEIRESEVGERTSAPNGRGNFYKDSPKDLSNISSLDFPTISQPLIEPIWRGSFNIWNRDGKILNGLLAHMSNKACQKVHDEAIRFLPVLHLEMLPKSDVWPKSFETSEPTDENIALYFFPSEISESIYDHLVDEMMNEELAMKVLLTSAELLIFSSMVLPLLHWRFKGKYYLWGVFRGRQNPPQSHSFRNDLGDNSVIHSDLSNDIDFNGGNNTVTAKSFDDAQSPLSSLSNSGSNVSGTF